VKPRVPLFVVALLIGASTWTMHRSTSADARAERTPEPRVPIMPLVHAEAAKPAARQAARPAAYSTASLDIVAAQPQTP
jgi:hypothetical protein